MGNWYKKVARRGTIPKMEDPDERSRNPYQPINDILTTPSMPAGRTHKRKGYPDNYSSMEDKQEDESVADMPHEPTLMDNDPPPGEGANDERFVSEVDKLKVHPIYEPTGPHNMQNSPLNNNVFDMVSKRSRLKKVNLV